MVLKTISDQIVIALNNAGLRRLVKNLSVTDEKSGLLKRASYLDLLMAETKRGIQQGTPVTVLLMQFGRSAAMVKEFGEAAVEAAMRQIGQLFATNIRQNDLAFRYEMTTVAIVLGETAEKEGLMAVEKLRKVIASVTLPEKEGPIPFSAGLAEAVVRQQYRSGGHRHGSDQSRRTGAGYGDCPGRGQGGSSGCDRWRPRRSRKSHFRFAIANFQLKSADHYHPVLTSLRD